MIHNRALRLSPDGRIARRRGQLHTGAWPLACRWTSRDEFAIRFHLHPSVKANRLSDGRGVILLLPDKELWTFNTYGDAVQIEESVFLSGSDGPRRTVQIVIYGHAREASKVRWTFRHTPPAAAGTRPERPDEPELPL